MKTLEVRLNGKLESTMKAFMQLKSEISALLSNKDGVFDEEDKLVFRKIGQMDNDLCDMMLAFGEIIGLNIFENAVNDANEYESLRTVIQKK